ncbi:MAG: OmpA family protein [Candidatus Kapaibacterium sp.]|jgi:outer membrane protein OmpA-like peptidoglycan-associated protein
MINKLILFALLLFAPIAVFGQLNRETSDSKKETRPVIDNKEDRTEYVDFYTYKLAHNKKDTILTVRRHNNWWFGLIGGPNFSIYFGDLYSKQNPSISIVNIANKIVDLSRNSLGYGYYIGLIGEYIFPKKPWGVGLRIIPFDKEISNVKSEEIPIGLEKIQNTTFDFYSNLTYATVSPFVKYNFKSLGGLYATAGLDANINYSSFLKQVAKFDNSGHIIHDYDTISYLSAKSRFGINIGVGYDIFFGDIFSWFYRMRLTPFIDFKIGTPVITDFNSNWNNIGIKVGLQLKVSPDKVVHDTLYYDEESTYTEIYVATIKDETGLEYPGFGKIANPPVIDLAVVEFPEEPTVEVAVIQDTTAIVKTDDKKSDEIIAEVKTTETQSRQLPRLRLRDTSNIYFASSAATTLTDAQKLELDRVVSFMKDNPNIIARVEGHSDNRGTQAQNTNRANRRAMNAMDYIMSKGIPRSRIFAQGRGALFPVATNDTEAGRRRNRRVEIYFQTN